MTFPSQNHLYLWLPSLILIGSNKKKNVRNTEQQLVNLKNGVNNRSCCAHSLNVKDLEMFEISDKERALNYFKKNILTGSISVQRLQGDVEHKLYLNKEKKLSNDLF